MAISLQREAAVSEQPGPGPRRRTEPAGQALARLAVRLVLPAERAVLAQLKPVRVVAPVLARDVVAVLAFLAGQRDLGPDVSRSHEARLSLVRSVEAARQSRGAGMLDGVSVAEAGLEPATQRL